MPTLNQHQSSEFTSRFNAFVYKDTRFDNATIKLFYSYFDVHENGCWIWNRYKDDNGYGRFRGKLAHRIMWLISGKSFTPGKELRHTCKNRCINPDHMIEGTHKENMEDAAIEGIMTGPRIMQPSDWAKVRELYAKGVTKAELARRFGVSKPLMTKFFKGDIKNAKP